MSTSESEPVMMIREADGRWRPLSRAEAAALLADMDEPAPPANQSLISRIDDIERHLVSAWFKCEVVGATLARGAGELGAIIDALTATPTPPAPETVVEPYPRPDDEDDDDPMDDRGQAEWPDEDAEYGEPVGGAAGQQCVS